MYKIDIVGGSLSGLASAIILKENNKDFEVVVHEKHKKIGFNIDGRRCGEAYYIADEWARWKPDKESIYSYISEIKTYVKNKSYALKSNKETSFVLNRQKFIAQLGRQAKKLNVKIKTNDKIESVEDLDCDYIIDASGCPSVIKKELGLNKGIKGVSYQQTLENSNKYEPDKLKIILTATGGYYWNFPRNPEKNEINLGIGTIYGDRGRLKYKLEKFKKENNITGEINHEAGGLVPAGIQKPLIYKNILFVGDTGIGTFPLTGEGIYRALFSGDLAARAILSDNINNYPKFIYQNFLKWDFLCKFFLQIIRVIGNISDDAIYFTWHRYLDWWYSLR